MDDSGLLLGLFAAYVVVFTLCKITEALGPALSIAVTVFILAIASLTGFVLSKRNV